MTLKTILVTGGTGYIGSHCAIELVKLGFEVIIVDNLSNSKIAVLDKIEQITGKKPEFYQIDLCDKSQLNSVFDAHSIDAVIHFAGLKAVGESVAFPLSYYQNNLLSTMSLLECMQNHQVWRLVFSSSATVYGENNPSPYNETMPTSATNPYGQTKLMIEQMLQDCAAANSNWAFASLRYFNPVGAHKSGLIGEDPNGIPNNLVPYIAQVAVGKRESVNVFGGDYATPDGTGVRDYIHISDLVDGHLSALNYLECYTGHQAINLGTGHGTSVLEMIEAFKRASGNDIPFTVVDRRPGDIAECYAETDLAKKLLNWTAEKTVEEMCQDSWKWQQLNPNGLSD